MTSNLTWILKELITACIKSVAKSKLHTLGTHDKDKNNETLCKMHARVDPGCLTPDARMQLQRVRERARGMLDGQNS